jgi:hypothetical protein
MGNAEVAAYRNVTTQAVTNARRRGKLPRPVAMLALGPVWKTSDIIDHFQEIDSHDQQNS